MRLFSALMLLQSDCSVDMSALPDDPLALILSHLPTDLDRRTTSKQFRGLSMFPLTGKLSTRYIQNKAFRNQVNARLPLHRMQVNLQLGGDIAKNYIVDVNYRENINAHVANPLKQIIVTPPADWTAIYIHDVNFRENIHAQFASLLKQIRLNLGIYFRKYMVNADFRATVDGLVDNPLEQVWSDVEVLDLSNTQVSDISALAGLKNLKGLYLRNTQVSNITSLTGLKNLKNLALHGTQVTDVSSLFHLRGLTISR